MSQRFDPGHLPRTIVRLWSRAPLLWTAALGMLVAVPSLTVGLILDDFVVRETLVAMVNGQEPRVPWPQMATIASGDPIETLERRTHAIVPWWTLPGVRIAFYRPLVVLTYLPDYAFWPDALWAMHLHSVLWYGLLCLLAGLACVELGSDRRIALLAAVFYALDDGHALAISWLSARSVLMAACFSFAALLAHHRWRRQGWKAGAWLAPIALLAALLSAEMAACFLGYFVAYAFSFDRASLRYRIASLLPAVATTMIWRVGYVALGYGAYGSGFYVDPIHAPLLFLTEAPQRMGSLLGWQFGLPFMLLAHLSEPVAWAASFAAVVPIGAGVLWLIARRARGDPEIRFWSMASVVSLVPLVAAPPSEHLMLISGLGGSALLAHLVFATARSWPGLSPARRWAAGPVTGAALVIHLLLAAVFLSYGTYAAGRVPARFGFSHAPVLGEDPELHRRDVVVVNGPNCMHSLQIPYERIRRGQPFPAHTWLLGTASDQDVEVLRVDANTLQLTAEGGYLKEHLATFFRAPGHPFHRGEQIRLLNNTVAVVEVTDDGRPLKIWVRFDVPLEHEDLLFIAWDGRDYARFDLPKIGQRVLLPNGQLRRSSAKSPKLRPKTRKSLLTDPLVQSKSGRSAAHFSALATYIIMGTVSHVFLALRAFLSVAPPTLAFTRLAPVRLAPRKPIRRPRSPRSPALYHSSNP